MNSYAPFTLAAAVLLACLSAGCEEHDHDHAHASEPPAGEACEHTAEGPAQAIVSTVGSGPSPAVGYDHKRYDIEPTGLSSGSGEGSAAGSGEGSAAAGFTGLVSLPVDAAGDYILFFSSDVQVGVFAADGTEVPLEATMQPIEECPATVAKGLTYPLAVGTYTISISSSTAAAVSLVVEPAGADDHQH